jgi:two-component system, LytTR family, response regulator
MGGVCQLSGHAHRMTGATLPLRAIIADDEPLARQALRRFLAADGHVDVVAEAEDLPSLRIAVQSHAADVVFLDITMPGGTGFDVLPLLPPQVCVVFTTAHAEHAVTAFEIDAVDYLVKPFGVARVSDALQRVRRVRTARAAQATVRRTVLLVRVAARLEPVHVDAIWRLEGCDDFVRVITSSRNFLHGTTLATLVAELDDSVFVRVHRSHVINVRHVTRVRAHDERRLAAEFPDGSRVVCSRSGSALLRAFARGPAE